MEAGSERRGPHTHGYAVHAAWSGSTGVGYDRYERAHRIVAPPAEAGLDLSGDPAFGGDGGRLNPEALLLAAATSCQLLSLLAVAARARIDVIGYHDDAEAVMPEDDRPVRITEITLRPRITVRAPATVERVLPLVAVAHRECFIANSLRSTIRIEPTISVVGDVVYHLAVRDEWEEARRTGGPYRCSTLGRSLAEEGFVHCSTAAQVAGVADAFYRGRDDIVVLRIDPGRVGAEIRVEPVPGTGQAFPHVYGPIPIDAVVAAEPVAQRAVGRLDVERPGEVERPD